MLYILSGFNQFLLEFETGYLKGDVYWNVIFSSAFTVLGYIAGGVMLKKLQGGTTWGNKAKAFRMMFGLSYGVEMVGAVMILCLQAKYPSLVPIFLGLVYFGWGSGSVILGVAVLFLFPKVYHLSLIHI